jgi:hypothetical protein
LIPIAGFNAAFLKIFQRHEELVQSVWAEIKGPDLVLTVQCLTLDATYMVKDSLVYDLSPYYIASMYGLNADELRVTYIVRGVGDYIPNATEWKTRLAFGCELFAA